MNEAARLLAAPVAGAGLSARVEPGVPGAVDTLAGTLDPAYRFLRAAWFRAAGAEASLVVRAADGTPLAAFPTASAGPPALGARAVVGAYWPFRTVPLSARIDEEELTALLADRAVRNALGPLWRMGPCYADDAAGARLAAAAPAAGWTMLTRRIGQTWLLDTAELRAAGPWPRPSTLKRIRNYERQLAREGEISWERVAGAGWNGAAFDAMARIEEASWIASGTDGSGAKFSRVGARAIWEGAVADPALAGMLSSLILRVGGAPAAFCFDLNCGTLQYSIAGSFDARFAAWKAGKLATYANLAWALERGIARIDWGAGDSGYKQEMGAVEGPHIVDRLFVRSPFVASMLRARWERAVVESEGDDARQLPLGRRGWLLLASLATAAAAGTLAE